MNKQEIMNTYAIKQGYECWWELLHYCMKNGNVQYHIDKVTDLIQEELKKKIAKNPFPKFLYECDGQLKIGYQGDANVSDEWLSYIKTILNTEIL